MANIDQYSDPAFAKLTNMLQDMPAFADFVKSAEFDLDEADQLPASAFADAVSRKYPIHTEKHAALSYAYAQSAQVDDDVMARIKEALEVYDISIEIYKTPETKLAAAEEPTYLLPKYKAFPLIDAETVKQAEEGLAQVFPKLNTESRIEACATLIKKAADFGVPLRTAHFHKYAGQTLPRSSDALAELMELRAMATKQASNRQLYLDLASVARKTRITPDTAAKFAGQLYEIDKKADLVRMYNSHLPDPIDAVYTDKRAAEMIDLNGRQVSLAKLAKVDPQVWEELLGKEGMDEIAPAGSVDSTRLASVVNTLPMDLKAILASQVR